jgi:ADP-ribose pyrophosphatase YjhB (NUDIX family)
MTISRFNVRVYGILINDKGQILVADELIKGTQTTKFPGGGLELGEGLRDGLAREFKEECDANVLVTDHFYTTDFFVPSAFDHDSQMISVYYRCTCLEWERIKASDKKFDYIEISGKDAESFRWVNLMDLHQESDVNLAIDKVVVKMLIEGVNSQRSINRP